MSKCYQNCRENPLQIKGFTILKGFIDPYESSLFLALDSVIQAAPFRFMHTPKGHKMSVGMTNCGAFGWVTDKLGYRYESKDPISGFPWPSMPEIFLLVAKKGAEQVGFYDFKPDACLINLYEPGAKLSLHQDKDEIDLAAPIVSISLGIQAIFLFGGLRRTDFIHKILVMHGDLLVFGGAARLAYHGIMPIKKLHHPKLGAKRINLTFRQAK